MEIYYEDFWWCLHEYGGEEEFNDDVVKHGHRQALVEAMGEYFIQGNYSRWGRKRWDRQLPKIEYILKMKYKDQFVEDHDTTEFILFMKNLIENIDCDKKETYEREKEYLLYLIRQKEEAANKGYLLNNDIINYMDMPNPY